MKQDVSLARIMGICAALALPVAAVANDEPRVPSETQYTAAAGDKTDGAGDKKDKEKKDK